MLRSTTGANRRSGLSWRGRNPDSAFDPATKDPDQAFTVQIKENIKFKDEKPKLSASEMDSVANMCLH
jgi:hypothetical protein